MTVGTRKAGRFCWINMLSPQPSQACEFFGKLLGWTFFEMPGIGFGVKVAGHDIGGIFDTVSPRTPNGTAPIIGVMVKVDHVDAMAERVRSLGGKAEAPFDIMEAGRLAVCHDPNGANFDLWQPRKMHGTDVDSLLPGAPRWFETLTTDVDRAKTFYESLLGWTSETMNAPAFSYTRFKLGAELVAGMMEITPEMAAAHMRPHWGVYFTVTDVDATAREAGKLGATICVPPRDILNVGRFAGIISPQGVMFYVIKYGA
jgi:uncharacterized protein